MFIRCANIDMELKIPLACYTSNTMIRQREWLLYINDDYRKFNYDN